MTQEEINTYRTKTDKNSATILSNYAKANGGPQPHGCLCKSSNVIKYITTFFNWFDNE